MRLAGAGERPAAGLAFRRFYGEPPAQVVGYPFVGDGVPELAVLELLRGDPGLGLRPVVEGPAAADASTAGVLSELLGFSNTAAVTWVHDAGGDWSRYAADLAQQRDHQPAEFPNRPNDGAAGFGVKSTTSGIVASVSRNPHP